LNFGSLFVASSRSDLGTCQDRPAPFERKTKASRCGFVAAFEMLNALAAKLCSIMVPCVDTTVGNHGGETTAAVKFVHCTYMMIGKYGGAATTSVEAVPCIAMIADKHGGMITTALNNIGSWFLYRHDS